MKNKMMVLGVLSLMLTSASVFADEVKSKSTTSDAPGVEKRVEHQKARIQHKLKKGKITQAQADQLNQEVNAVQADKEKLEQQDGGKLKKVDRKKLHQELKKTSENIKAAGTSTGTSVNK